MESDPPGDDPLGIVPEDRAETPEPAAPSRLVRSRWVPAFLSALVPGLGQLVEGRRGLAILFGLPVVVLLVGALGAVLVLGPARLGASLLEPAVIVAIIAIQAALVGWRLLASGVAFLDRRYPRPRPRDILPAALLAALIIVPQGWALAVTEAGREAADQVFVDPGTTGAWVPSIATPTTTSTPELSLDPSPSPSPDPSPSPSPAVPRVNVLLIGVDAGVGRRTYLTDTLIVASLDPVAKTVSMISIPRDMVDVPLPGGRHFAGKINSLLSYARLNRGQFPGSSGDGHDVLMAAIGTLLGMRIDTYAQVDLGGFVAVIDRLGGVDVNVAHSFCDPSYDEYGYANGFSITAGRHHLGGVAALAYARVRKAAGESDFTRAARQQEVLSGVRDAVVRGGFLDDPIGLFRALARTVQTNVSRGALPDIASWATQVDRGATYRAVITHPLVRSGFDKRGSIQIPDLVAIRALVAKLFPPSGTLPAASTKVPAALGGRATTSGVGSCAPAARPTPRPTTSPTSPVSPAASTSPSPGGSPSPSPSPGPASPSPSPPPASPSPSPSRLPATPSPSPAPPASS